MKKTVKTFGAATLAEVKKTVCARVDELKATEIPRIKVIAKGNHKTGDKIPVFNMPPLVTCTNCAACSKHCYAVKDYSGHRVKAVCTSHSRNLAAVLTDPEKAFADLDKWLTRHKPAFFRVHASGDFAITINGDPLEYGRVWYRLAELHPETHFLAFTKSYHVAREIPFDTLGNFELVLSEWTDELTAPDDLKKRYRTSRAVRELSDARPDEIICPGSCEDCGMCWTLSAINRNVAFEIH